MRGMGQLRETGDWFVDYRELVESETYKAGFEELVRRRARRHCRSRICVQEDLEAVAAEHPDQQFALIDGCVLLCRTSYRSRFEEGEGSMLAGAVAGIETESNQIGFIGGVDNELIEKFKSGLNRAPKK